MSLPPRRWLALATWDVVVAVNAQLCDAKRALHKPTSDGHEPARALWVARHAEAMTLREVGELGLRCHRMAPFCFYNGNTFVTIARTAVASVVDELPSDDAARLRSVLGHYIAGVANARDTDEALREIEDRLSRGPGRA